MILQRIAPILTLPRARGFARLSAAMKETTAVLEVTPNSVLAKQMVRSMPIIQPTNMLAATSKEI